MSILRLGPVATFVAAAGNNDNVDPGPGDINTINRLYVDTTAGAATIRSIVAGLDGQLLWVLNLSGGNPLTLNNASGTSPAANNLSGGSDITIEDGDSLLIFYDAGSIVRWIMGV
jgi:hypothetical protein